MSVGETERRSKGTASFFIATGVGQACALIRYTLLARILGPEQLGLAATVILTAQFFDSVTDGGTDRFLIQDPDGDEPRVQHLVQTVSVMRGFFSCACLVVLCSFIAGIYRTPVLAPGLALLGLAPLLGGFMHLDLRRVQRHNDFRNEGLSLATSELCSLLVTTVLAIWLKSYLAVVYGQITRYAVQTLVSHLTAERPYALGIDRKHLPRLSRFSLPLVANGVLLFFGAQGDRIWVGRELGMAELGAYSAVSLLVFYPTITLMRVINALNLPLIARDRERALSADGAADLFAGQTQLISVAVLAGFALAGPLAVAILFGSRFSLPATSIAVIGALQAARLLRAWPGTSSLALGRSGVVLAGNIARLIAFPAAVIGAKLAPGVDGVLGGFLFGEMVALVLSVVLLNRAEGFPLSASADRMALFLIAIAVTIGWTLPVLHRSAPLMVGLGLVTLALMAWLWVRERRAIQSMLTLAITQFNARVLSRAAAS